MARHDALGTSPALVAVVAAVPAFAQCPAAVPAQCAALPGPLPLFPADNGWNADVSQAPVDPGSAAFIASSES